MNSLSHFLLIIGLLSAGAVNAQQYHFATFSFDPWSFKQDNAVSGIIPDIVNAIATEAGLSITIEIVPYARMVKRLREGVIDFAILSRNPDNDMYVVYAAPLFVQNVVLLTRKGNRITALDKLSRQNKVNRVGVLRGTDFIPEIIKSEKFTSYQIKDFSQGLKMLNLRRIDAFLTIERTSLYQSEKLGLTNAFEFPGFYLGTMEAWLQVSRNSPNQENFPYRAVRDAVKRLNDRGVIDAIINGYIGKKPQ